VYDIDIAYREGCVREWRAYKDEGVEPIARSPPQPIRPDDGNGPVDVEPPINRAQAVLRGGLIQRTLDRHGISSL
jgi:hypothetical protein